MPTPAESAYTRVLVAARSRGYALTADGLELIEAAFRQAARDLTTELALSDNPVTRARATALRRQVLDILSQLEQRVALATERQVLTTIDDIVAMHQRAHVALAERYAGGLPSIAEGFAQVPARAIAVFASRGGVAATFRTLMRRHMLDAAPQLDRLLASAIIRGQSTRNLARDIVTLLQGQDPEGIDPTDVAGLRTLRSDALRIARTEPLNALREANAQAMMASPIIEAAKWQLSGNHGEQIRKYGRDACDVLASVLDLYGYGPGYYLPHCWPLAPHPNCACYQGGPTKFRPPRDWGKPPVIVACQVPDLGDLDDAAWTPADLVRVRAQVEGALRGGIRTAA
jgi:hypothetical protein